MSMRSCVWADPSCLLELCRAEPVLTMHPEHPRVSEGLPSLLSLGCLREWPSPAAVSLSLTCHQAGHLPQAASPLPVSGLGWQRPCGVSPGPRRELEPTSSGDEPDRCLWELRCGGDGVRARDKAGVPSDREGGAPAQPGCPIQPPRAPGSPQGKRVPVGSASGLEPSYGRGASSSLPGS